MVDLDIKLPEGFLEEEVRCDYTVTREMKEVWAVELDLLSELQRVCNKYNLKYFASGGTLLGAVRHHGFIPWDDDIDIAMLREDYEKLKNLGNNVFKEGYFLQSTYNDNIVRAHMQLRKDGTAGLLKDDFGKKYHMGIFIDIFVFDNIPGDTTEFQKFKNKLSKYYNLISIPSALPKPNQFTLKYAFKQVKRTIKRRRNKVFVAIQGGRIKSFQKFENMAQRYNNDNTENIAAISFMCVKRKVYIYKKKNFEQTVLLPFENIYLSCPAAYDENLTVQYGDYTKFVIGSSMHGGTFFDVNHSYKNYMKMSEEEFARLFDEEE